MKKLQILTAIAAFLAGGAWFPSSAFSAEEVCAACDKKIVVTGQFEHGTSDTFVIQNAPGNEAAFRDEIRGANFVLTVPDLVAGTYILEIGLAELQHDRAGQRLFDIVSGDQVIATNLDIFAAAGGMNKVLRIRAQVEHPGDAVRGPFSVRFIARLGDAKLNPFELWDSSGVSIISIKAVDLITGADAAALGPPVVGGPVLWRDPAQPLETRVKDLIRGMSLAEKAAAID